MTEAHTFSLTFDTAINYFTEFALITVEKEGYYPVAIAGWTISGSMAAFNTLRIINATEGSCNISFRILNPFATATEFHGTVYILWLKIIS